MLTKKNKKFMLQKLDVMLNLSKHVFSSKYKHMFRQVKHDIAVLFSVVFLLVSCAEDEKYDKTKAVSAFAAVEKIKVDEDLAKVEIKLPKQVENSLWSGSVAYENQRIENFAKDFSHKKSGEIALKKSAVTWNFYSGNFNDRFVFTPIFDGDKAFILNASGHLIAYDIKQDKRIFKKRLFPSQFLKNYQTPKIFLQKNESMLRQAQHDGGGDDKIFAIAGSSRIVAAKANNGEIIWTKDISAIPVSAPIADENSVYVTTNDNKLYALDAANGNLRWMQAGVTRPTAIFGAANPVIYKNLVIATYSSGEIYGVDKKTGEALWSQDLNLSKATSSDFYLNDIDATPLVKDDVIYAIGNGGLMMAINVKNGNYIWKKEIAGIVDFWAAGEFLYVINNDDKLLAVYKKTGGIKWISQLPNYKNDKKPQTKIIYAGVVMAGDKLVISSVAGDVLMASPFDGKIEKIYKTKSKTHHSPVVVNGKIYLHSMGKWVVDLLEVK